MYVYVSNIIMNLKQHFYVIFERTNPVNLRIYLSHELHVKSQITSFISHYFRQFNCKGIVVGFKILSYLRHSTKSHDPREYFRFDKEWLTI